MDVFKKILSLLTPAELKKAWVMILLMLIGMILETLSIGLVIPSLSLMMQGNTYINHPSLHSLLNFIGNPTQAQIIAYAMIGLVIIYFIKNSFLAFLAWQQVRFASDVLVNASQRLFAVYLRQQYAFHLQHNSAQLMRNVAGEVSVYSGAITSALLLLTESMVLLGIAILLMVVQPVGASIVVTVVGVIAFIYSRKTRTHIAAWGLARQYHEGLRIQHLQQGLNGAKDVKLLGREEDFLKQYHIHNLKSARVGELQATLQQIPRLFLEILAIIGLAILVITMLSQGRNISSIIPTLGLFAAAAFRLMPSLNRILNAIQTLRYSMPAINVLCSEFILAAPDKKPDLETKSLGFQSLIKVEDVTFNYLNVEKPAVNNLSLTIEKGQSIGLIGASGSGKSTLVDIILGLLTPIKGRLVVDKVDIQHNLRKWQDQIGYVPQSIYLTDDSLRRNVAFGLPDDEIDDKAVERAIKSAQLDEFVATLPDGLETIVGERGIRLSGGQRQRIGIARALYHDPAVIVLDEATSALDIHTEAGVMQSINALHGSKTIIIVAHRLSTVEYCDQIYRMEKGSIMQQGSPADILKPNKISA